MVDSLEEFVIDVIKSTGVGLWIAAVITYKINSRDYWVIFLAGTLLLAGAFGYIVMEYY